MATAINPTDPLSTLGIRIEDKSKASFCSICNSSVQIKTKHCGKCNRCVTSFDHHCKWLNNCIGQKNYKCFMIALCSFAVNSALIITISVISLIDFYVEKETELEFDEKIHKIQAYKSWVVEICILLVYATISLVLAGNLICFHIWINWKGISTVEYVLEKRKKTMRKVHTEMEIVTKEPEKVESKNEISSKQNPDKTEISLQ